MTISSVILVHLFSTIALPSKPASGKSTSAPQHIYGGVICKAKQKYSKLRPVQKDCFLLLK